MWKCSNCGHVHIDDDVPKECSICQHPQDYFELQSFNYM